MRRVEMTMRMAAIAVACLLWPACGRSPAPDHGYWSTSCVSGDGRYLFAGGDHTALVDLVGGRVVERLPGMVRAVGCDASGGIVIGYTAALHWPAKTAAGPMPRMGDTVLARDAAGAWISASRPTSGGKWRGPASVLVSGGTQGRVFELLPRLFGEVGSARPLPFADTFAVRFGNLMQDGRLSLAAGWQPSRSSNQVEDVPWAFFALDLGTGALVPLTPPLESTVAINQAWLQRIAATPDGARLVVATHDGAQLTVAQFERGSHRPSQVTTLAAPGSPSAVSLSADGAFVAVAAETRGPDAPATVWVLDRQGQTVWTGPFRKNVAGLHFLADGSLVIAAGEAKAVKVALPGGIEKWRAE